MSKRRITLSLDADLVDALEAIAAGGQSLSATANVALREAVALAAHRASLGRWLDKLDARHGAATPEERAAAQALADELMEGADPARHVA